MKKQLNSKFPAVLPLLLWTVAFSSGAHSHFALAPKIEIAPLSLEEPRTTFIRLNELKASRGDFTDYLQRITAFDTKYDRVQPSFFSHFEIIRGIAFFHPDNVHKYIGTIAQTENQPAFHQLAVSTWFKKQAEIFSRTFYFPFYRS